MINWIQSTWSDIVNYAINTKNLLMNYSVVIWMTWVLIPLIMEIIPSLVNLFLLVVKKIGKKKNKDLNYFPDVSILIPVYNSQESLERCLSSIYESTYPNDAMNIMLINNKSRDDSFEIYKKCQEKFPSLRMQWMNSDQGKSRALNLALYNASGKYIINIDSDGLLEKNAIMNIVKRFESDDEIACLTGVILTNPDLIKKTKRPFLKLIRKLEYVEYCQAFLAGRNYESETNTIFTLSGAFSSFRKSTILKTQMYNTDTICEDTQLTFQVKNNLKGKIALCEDAIYITDPIDDMSKLYTQRQRWQIGELEVFHMFYNKKKLKLSKFFTDRNIRLLVYDHTFAFPRFAWYFGMLLVGYVTYDMSVIIAVLILMYLLYVFSSIMYYFSIIHYLKNFKEYKKYYATKILYLFLFPFYNLLIFLIRFLGIINSIGKKSTWKTDNIREEYVKIKQTIKEDFTGVSFKKNKDSIKKKLFSFLIIFVCITNLGIVYSAVQANENSKVVAYKHGQDKVLDSLVDGAGTVYSENSFYKYVKDNDVLSNQLWFIYNTKNEKFINYDNRLGISTGFIVQNLNHNFENEVVIVDSGALKYLMNARQIVFDDTTFYVGILTSKIYILNNSDSVFSKEFILFEVFCLQLLIILFIVLFVENRKKTDKGDKNDSTVEKMVINTPLNNNVEITNLVKPAVFFSTLGKIEKSNRYSYELFKCAILNKNVLKLLEHKNILLMHGTNNIYYILIVNMTDDEKSKIMNRISNNEYIQYEKCTINQIIV